MNTTTVRWRGWRSSSFLIISSVPVGVIGTLVGALVGNWIFLYYAGIMLITGVVIRPLGK